MWTAIKNFWHDESGVSSIVVQMGLILFGIAAATVVLTTISVALKDYAGKQADDIKDL